MPLDWMDIEVSVLSSDVTRLKRAFKGLAVMHLANLGKLVDTVKCIGYIGAER